MGEGFTPTFFLQLIIAIASGGVAYGAIKADIRSMHERLDRGDKDLDRRFDEQKAGLERQRDSIHDLRDDTHACRTELEYLKGQAKRS